MLAIVTFVVDANQIKKADLATEQERQFTTARSNQTTGLTNSRAANWAVLFTFCCLTGTTDVTQVVYMRKQHEQ